MNFDLISFLKTSVAAFLGSGLAVVVLQAILAWHDKRVERQVQTLKDKLHRLYAPLFFFTSQNEECYQLWDKLQTAMDSDSKKVTDNQGVQHNSLGAGGIEQTIDISNDYIRVVDENNDQIVNILRDYWMYIDPDDIDVFREMIVDHLRLKTEFGPDGKSRTPVLVGQAMGKIRRMRPEFVDRVKTKFLEKQKRLGALGMK